MADINGDAPKIWKSPEEILAEQEAQKKMKEREIMIDLYQGKKEQREITSSTYISADRRQSKDIQNFLSWGRR